MKFVPTTLHDNPQFVQDEITRLSGLNPRPERFQLDIIDGEFADNITVEPGLVHELDMGGMALDLHLMVVEPLEWLSEVRECASLDIVIAQVERMTSIEAFVDEVVNELGARVGLALDLYTPFSAIPEEVLPQLSVVQIMANSAGFQGQSFNPVCLATIADAAAAKNEHGYAYDIAVDIGMTADTISQIAGAGATMAVIGSYLNGAAAQERWSELQQMELSKSSLKKDEK